MRFVFGPWAPTRVLPRCLMGGAALTALTLVVTGCSGSPAQQSGSIAPGSSSSLTLDGVTVSIPADAVSAAGTLTLTAEDPQEANLGAPGIVPLEGVDVSLAGALLTGVAVVSFPRPANPDNDPLLVLWSDGNGGWLPRPTETAPDGTVTAQTDHFSPAWLSRIDVKRWASDAMENLKNIVTSRSDVAQPSCGDEEAPRSAGIRVTSDSGDSIKWCYGVEDGRTVVKVANNRRTFTTVTYPKAWKVKKGTSVSLSQDTIARFFGDSFATTGKRAARTIDGGSTLTLLPPEGAGGRVIAEADFPAWAFGAIVFGLDVASGMASKLGVAEASGTSGRFIDLVTGGGDSSSFQALQACTRSAADNLADGDVGGSFGESANAVVKFLWQCLPSYITADVREAGFALFGAGAVLRVIEGAATAVLTAAHLLLTGSREIYDNFASLGGDSSATYEIAIRQPSSSTTQGSGSDSAETVDSATGSSEPPDSAPPAQEFSVGSTGTYRCIVAWPFAPSRSSDAVAFRSTCSGQPRSILFVDITVPDPEYTPPGSSPFLVTGRIVDEVRSDMGFSTLVLLASGPPQNSG